MIAAASDSLVIIECARWAGDPTDSVGRAKADTAASNLPVVSAGNLNFDIPAPRGTVDVATCKGGGLDEAALSSMGQTAPRGRAVREWIAVPARHVVHGVMLVPTLKTEKATAAAAAVKTAPMPRPADIIMTMKPVEMPAATAARDPESNSDRKFFA